MGFTPSAATAADLLGMLTLACTMTLRSSKRALWIFLLCAAFCAFNATAMDGNNAAPGHAWTPGRHIIAMPESGHPAIMDGIFGAPCPDPGLHAHAPATTQPGPPGFGPYE